MMLCTTPISSSPCCCWQKALRLTCVCLPNGKKTLYTALDPPSLLLSLLLKEGPEADNGLPIVEETLWT